MARNSGPVGFAAMGQGAMQDHNGFLGGLQRNEAGGRVEDDGLDAARLGAPEAGFDRAPMAARQRPQASIVDSGILDRKPQPDDAGGDR